MIDPWKSSDFMLAREARRHGRRPPAASSQAYPRHRDIVRFENPTRPPFLRGGQRLWRGRSYSPSELRYTPRPISRDRRSKSHSPASVCRRRTPTIGAVTSLPQAHSRCPSSSVCSLHGKTPSPALGRPDTPAPRATVQGGIIPSSNSAFTPIRHQSPTPSPSPFYDFTGYRLEERSFLSSLCDEIGTVGDLQSVAASLGLKYSRVEQILTSFPHDFPAAVFATLAGWYTASRSMFWKKLDDLEDAFKELHKGALFNRIVNAHSVVLQRVSSLPRIRLPSSDTLDESLGEAVMNAVEIIPSCHLRLLRTLLREILSDGDLLTVAAACGIAPVVAVCRHRVPDASILQGCSGVSSVVRSVRPHPEGEIPSPEIWFPVRQPSAGLQQYCGRFPPDACRIHTSDNGRTSVRPHICSQHLRERRRNQTNSE